ncbi:MAG: nitrite reductase small subunit [Mycobacterium sp.]|jgi:nitrite reductase (NADH) small subunit|nr:nitrite reductase small subunit [Mycobacterium sp.]
MTAHVIGTLEEIPIGEGRAFAVDGTQVAVYRLRDGSLRALAAVCPHRGGPLADGLMDGRVVVCPLHGHTYDLTTGTELGGSHAVCAYTATVADDGTILIETRSDL